MSNSTVIGLRNLVYSIMTKDDFTGVAYNTVKNIIDAMDAKITPKTNSDIVYADDGPSEVITVQGETTVELGVKYLPLDVQADLLGHSIVGGVLIRKASDIPPYVAIGYKTVKSNNKFRYIWLLKGKFEVPDQENQTKEAKANPKYPKLKGTFVKRNFDDAWIKETDEDYSGYNNSIGANWFNAVENPDPTSPSIVSTIPGSNAVGVQDNTTYQWVFNAAIDSSTVNTNNFYLIKDLDGTVVPATVVYNSSSFNVTLTPNSQLAAASKYIAVVTADVADLYGTHIAPTNRIFTTQ